jgi:integration host factor subunit alpha
MEKLITDKQGGKTITRTNLADALRKQVRLSRNESDSLLEDVLNEISACLATGGTFKMHNFGSFSIRQKNERIGRNPKTGEEVPIPPRKVVVFKASEKLKEQTDLRNN